MTLAALYLAVGLVVGFLLAVRIASETKFDRVPPTAAELGAISLFTAIIWPLAFVYLVAYALGTIIQKAGK